MSDDEQAGGPSPSEDPLEKDIATPRNTIPEQIKAATELEELKALIVVPEFIKGCTVAKIAMKFGWPHEKIHGLLVQYCKTGRPPSAEERLRRTRLLPRIDAASLSYQLIVSALLFVVFLAILNPGVLMEFHVAATEQYTDIMFATPGQPSQEQLQIANEDVNYLNRIFRERTTEVGYCALMTNGTIRPWLAESDSATGSSIVVSATNCPTAQYDQVGLLHTHPGGDPRLSEADRTTLQMAEIPYVCVQHGRITAAKGDVTDRLRCYISSSNQSTDEPIQQVPIRVTADSTP